MAELLRAQGKRYSKILETFHDLLTAAMCKSSEVDNVLFERFESLPESLQIHMLEHYLQQAFEYYAAPHSSEQQREMWEWFFRTCPKFAEYIWSIWRNDKPTLRELLSSFVGTKKMSALLECANGDAVLTYFDELIRRQKQKQLSPDEKKKMDQQRQKDGAKNRPSGNGGYVTGVTLVSKKGNKEGRDVRKKKGSKK